MGLDMYLFVRRRDGKGVEIEDYPSKELGNLAEKTGSTWRIKQETYQVMYWRKANQIHKFFVDRCAGGEDDCREMYVEKDVLDVLYTKCLKILADPKCAEDELPTESGFFFGSTDYDDNYMADIKVTINFLKDFLEIMAKEEYENYSIIYEASW